MKNRNPVWGTLVVLLLLSANCFAQVLAVEPPVGAWTTEKPHPSGVVVQVNMHINEDHTFEGVALMDEVVIWEYAGTWEMSGNKFTATYLESSLDLPENYQDEDFVISVDANEYVARSQASGETHTFTRIK